MDQPQRPFMQRVVGCAHVVGQPAVSHAFGGVTSQPFGFGSPKGTMQESCSSASFEAATGQSQQAPSVVS